MSAEVRQQLLQYYSEAQLREILTAMRRPPPTTLRVNSLTGTREEALKLVQEHLSTLAPEGTAPMLASAPEFPPDCIEIQGGGPMECDVGETEKVVVVERKAGEMVMRGAQVYAPGVIATSSGISVGPQLFIPTPTLIILTRWCRGSSAGPGFC